MSGRRENRRVLRLTLPDPLKVVIGSMGSTVRYEMQTHDISSSGLFLDFERPSRFPFNNATILEVWLEMEPGVSIFFNGKVARTVKSGETTSTSGSGIGVHIVQIDKEADNQLRSFIERICREQKDKIDGAA